MYHTNNPPIILLFIVISNVVFSLEGDNKELNLVPIRSSRCAAERRYLKSTEPPKSPLPFAQVTHLHLIPARQLLLSCVEA